MKKYITPLLAVLLLTACTGLYRGVVTITSVVDSASREYAVLYQKGLVSDAVDQKVEKAHANYRQACIVAADALRQYKATGDNNAYLSALSAAKVAATGFIDLIVPLLSNSKAFELKTSLQKANTI